LIHKASLGRNAEKVLQFTQSQRLAARTISASLDDADATMKGGPVSKKKFRLACESLRG